MQLDQLETVRRKELQQVLHLIQTLQELRGGKPLTILEIGAGTGGQARILADQGHRVEAIDLISSNYAAERVWPITDYDGHHIPFPKHHFDIIFSSNVLEHIPHLPEYQQEMHRVLKPEGVAIHVVPSGSWRFWTNLLYYPYLCRRLIDRLFRAVGSGSQPRQTEATAPAPEAPPPQSIRLGSLLPNRHGVMGNFLSQIYYFSRRCWRRKFLMSGWTLKNHLPNRLFYTGYLLLEPPFKIETRTSLSQYLGSSCHIFVLKHDGVAKSPPYGVMLFFQDLDLQDGGLRP